MTETSRTWYLLRIAVVLAGLVILFFSGLVPIEDYLALVSPRELTASVVPSDVASLTNQNRISNGLPPLTVNPLLTQAAQLKADDMANNSYYAHISPDGKSPLYWLTAVGYKYLNAGENLVIDRNTSEEAVDAWMNSPDHRENILRPQFTEIGIGVAAGTYEGVNTIFVVEEFGTPYPLSAPAVRQATKPPATPVVTTPAPKTPLLVTNVKALVTPVVQDITVPAVTVTPKAPLAPKATATIPAPVAKPAPATMPAVKKAVQPTTTATTSASSASTTTSVVATTTTTFNYTLAPGFFTPTVFTGLHESPVAPSQETVPTTQNPTPTWFTALRDYIRRIANFVPRIW